MKVKHKELPHNYVPEMMRLDNLCFQEYRSALVSSLPFTILQPDAYTAQNSSESSTFNPRKRINSVCGVFKSIFTQHDRAKSTIASADSNSLTSSCTLSNNSSSGRNNNTKIKIWHVTNNAQREKS